MRLDGSALGAVVGWVLAAGLLGPGATSLLGQEMAEVSDSAAADAPTRGVQDRAELEAFLDGLMTAQMSEHNVAGATVSVVKDGELFFARGYGFADVAAREPVDPVRTMFRIGSISKLFTWTAVMQLVERGQIDLDADVNTYIDFEIPATYADPITMRHLLTHTPGLEEDGRDLFTTDPDHLTPMGEWLPAHMPARVRSPGVFSSYSNWGTALAGYVVERVSGQSYDEYLEEHLFEPLDMRYTTARQPLPDVFEDNMSKGYRWSNGGFVEEEWEIVTGAAPAGSMSSSAVDMARWMLAHLGRGSLGDIRILSPATAEAMHARHFAHDPRLPGWGLGFYEKSSHEVRMIGHGGDTGWFHSDLTLIPSDDVGVFVSYNTNTGGELSFSPFRRAFLDHYYPIEPREAVDVGDLERFAGTYLFNRMSYTTFQKAMNLGGELPVRALGDTALVLGSPFGDMRLIPVDSLLFADIDGQASVAFRADEDGTVTHAFMDIAPMMTLEKQAALASPSLHRIILGGSLAVFAAYVFAAVARWFRRRRWNTPEPPETLARGRRWVGWAALANLLFIAGLALAVSDQESLMSDSPTRLRVALVFPLAGVVLMLVGGWFAVQTWRRSSGGFFDRIRLTTTVVVGLLFAWSLHTWNLLGWRM